MTPVLVLELVLVIVMAGPALGLGLGLGNLRYMAARTATLRRGRCNVNTRWRST